MSDPRPVDDQPTLVGAMAPVGLTKAGPAHAVGSQPLPAPIAPPPPPNGLAPLPPNGLAPLPPNGLAPAVAVPKPANIELMVCPECGTTAMVTLNRRESTDFCRNCDYPLFWTPSAVLRDRGTDLNAESLRRLPGTVGRATIASLTCPHCAEPNAVSATICVRCGLPLHLVDAPAPERVYIPPPPMPYVEPERTVAWWVWALLVVGTAVLVTLIVLITTHTIS
jgi:hypothetical protein